MLSSYFSGRREDLGSMYFIQQVLYQYSPIMLCSESIIKRNGQDTFYKRHLSLLLVAGIFALNILLLQACWLIISQTSKF